MTPSETNAYRASMFTKIKEAKTREEAQQAALELWHHLNATQEGFICPGCANCAIVEDDAADLPPPSPSPER